MDAIIIAFQMVFEPKTVMVMLASSAFGLFVGAVPGLTATMATALLVPVTFFMPPIMAIAAIVTATAMAIFSGDIPGCLMRMPGTPASAAYTDEAGLMQLASLCAAVTTEFENVPAQSLAYLAAHTVVAPNADCVSIAQDRIRELEGAPAAIEDEAIKEAAD